MGEREWMPIESAPRDGTWVLIQGEMRGGDTLSAAVARWNPATIPVGDQNITYEWEALTCDALNWEDEGDLRYDDISNHYSEGRITGWTPLPSPPST